MEHNNMTKTTESKMCSYIQICLFEKHDLVYLYRYLTFYVEKYLYYFRYFHLKILYLKRLFKCFFKTIVLESPGKKLSRLVIEALVICFIFLKVDFWEINNSALFQGL